MVFFKCNFNLSLSNFKIAIINNQNVNFFKFIKTFTKFNNVYNPYNFNVKKFKKTN